MKSETSRRALPLMPEVEKFLKIHKRKIEYNKTEQGNTYNKKYLDFICVHDDGSWMMLDYVTKHFKIVLKKTI